MTKRTTLNTKQRAELTVWINQNSGDITGSTPADATRNIEQALGFGVSTSAVKSICSALGVSLGTNRAGESAATRNKFRTLAITMLELCEAMGHTPRLQESLRRIAENGPDA